MRRLAEFALFVPVAAGVHLAAFGLIGAPDGGGSAGMGGENAVTVQAVSPQVAALVQSWQAAPRVEGAAPPAPRAPDMPATSVLPAHPSAPRALVARPALPEPGLEAAPVPDTTPPPPPAPPKPAPPKPTPPKPAKAAPPKKPQAPVAAKRAAGAGGGAVAGKSAKGADPGAQKALSASWGAKIQARVARAHRVPKAAIRQGLSGTALVRLVVARDGRLMSAALRRSSGAQVLDKAALQTVRRVRRYPPAPKGFSGTQGVYDLPLSFSVN